MFPLRSRLHPRRGRYGRGVRGALAVLLASPAAAQAPSRDAAPLLTPRPVFVPGLYETESRNRRFQDQGVKSRTCLASADYEAFRRETMAQYTGNADFMKGCRLSETRDLPDGFAFAMDCEGSKVVLTFHFKPDLVSSTTQTLIPGYPKASSEILTLSRRVGECEGQVPDKGT